MRGFVVGLVPVYVYFVGGGGGVPDPNIRTEIGCSDSLVLVPAGRY